MVLLSLVDSEDVLRKGLEILVLSNETRLDESTLDGVRDARPGLNIRKVDRLEIKQLKIIKFFHLFVLAHTNSRMT